MHARNGFGLIEIVIASAVVSVALVSLVSVFVLADRVALRASDRVRANFLAEEGIEVMRFLRDKSWSAHLATLAPGTNYYILLDAVTSTWSVSTSDPGLIDSTFRRVITVASVERNANDDIVASGGTVDPDTLKIISTVTWGASEQVTLETYLSDTFDN